MRKDLIKKGFQPLKSCSISQVFRTLDSVVRTKKCLIPIILRLLPSVFIERAVFIAKHKGIDAQCLAVPTPSGMYRVSA